VARIAGVNIPSNKKVEVSLTYLFGVGKKNSPIICEKAKVDKNKRVYDLSEDEVIRLREIIEKEYKIEGELRREIASNIKALKDIKCYKGLRHIRKLPVRGQRTHTNARTKRGKAIPIAGKKQVAK
jgi:small subunit ribosomal protein S13